MNTQTDKTSPLRNNAEEFARSLDDLGSFNADAWRPGDPIPEVIRELVGDFEIVDSNSAAVAHQAAIKASKMSLADEVVKGAITAILGWREEDESPQLLLAYEDLPLFVVVDEDRGEVRGTDESGQDFLFEFHPGEHLHELRAEMLESVREKQIVEWHTTSPESARAEEAGQE